MRKMVKLLIGCLLLLLLLCCISGAAFVFRRRILEFIRPFRGGDGSSVSTGYKPKVAGDFRLKAL